MCVNHAVQNHGSCDECCHGNLRLIQTLQGETELSFSGFVHAAYPDVPQEDITVQILKVTAKVLTTNFHYGGCAALPAQNSSYSSREADS